MSACLSEKRNTNPAATNKRTPEHVFPYSPCNPKPLLRTKLCLFSASFAKKAHEKRKEKTCNTATATCPFGRLPQNPKSATWASPKRPPSAPDAPWPPEPSTPAAATRASLRFARCGDSQNPPPPLFPAPAQKKAGEKTEPQTKRTTMTRLCSRVHKGGGAQPQKRTRAVKQLSWFKSHQPQKKWRKNRAFKKKEHQP